jgi:hypothetical protein
MVTICHLEINIPSKVMLKNNKSARDNLSFVTTEIECLVEKHVISVADHVPEVVNPLTVAYNKAGKARLDLDCRHVHEQAQSNRACNIFNFAVLGFL